MWEIACPACRKLLQVATSSTANHICSRCQCELESLVKISNAAAAALARSQKLLSAGDGTGALEEARISWELRREPETAQTAFMAALLLADYDKADHWYEIAEKSSP